MQLGVLACVGMASSANASSSLCSGDAGCVRWRSAAAAACCSHCFLAGCAVDICAGVSAQGAERLLDAITCACAQPARVAVLRCKASGSASRVLLDTASCAGQHRGRHTQCSRGGGTGCRAAAQYLVDLRMFMHGAQQQVSRAATIRIAICPVWQHSVTLVPRRSDTPPTPVWQSVTVSELACTIAFTQFCGTGNASLKHRGPTYFARGPENQAMRHQTVINTAILLLSPSNVLRYLLSDKRYWM